MEFIKNIEELYNYNLDNCSYEGYKIITNNQEILILITDEASCCESFGYFSNHERLHDFSGAKLTAIEIVDECLTKNEYHLGLIDRLDCGSAMFVNLETSIGTLQLTVYNGHNGYYSHPIIIRANQLSKKDIPCSI